MEKENELQDPGPNRKKSQTGKPLIELSRLTAPISWNELELLARRSRIMLPGEIVTFKNARLYMDKQGLVHVGPKDWNPMQMEFQFTKGT